MKAATLTNDMTQALYDMGRNGARGPNNTGLGVGTYKALARRGLVKPSHFRRWRILKAGRDVLKKLEQGR